MSQQDLASMIEQEDTMKDKFLTFLLDGDVYALELHHVIEIIGVQEITRVPELPEYIKGVMNVRGKIVPVMDVRMRFGKEVMEYEDRTCIVIIQYDQTNIGLVVDTVADVILMKEEDIIDTPSIGRTLDMRFVKKIGKINDAVKMIIDCYNLLTEEEESLIDNNIKVD